MNILGNGKSVSELSAAEISAIAGGHPHQTATIQCKVVSGELKDCVEKKD